MKSRSSNDARKEWADVQADAMAGTPTAIERHDRRTCVVMPPEWGDFYSDAYWLRIMEDARQKFPGKDDPELIKEVLQRWAWQQGNGGSKDAKLDESISLLKEIREIVIWFAGKMGYKYGSK